MTNQPEKPIAYGLRYRNDDDGKTDPWFDLYQDEGDANRRAKELHLDVIPLYTRPSPVTK